MFLSNAEVKGFIRNYLILFIITIGLSIGISFVSINIIKNKVVENNQAIIGSIVAVNPSFEKEIINVITQGKSRKDLNLGKDILNKYNYNENISLNNEPIIKSSLQEIITLNALFVLVIFIAIILLVMVYFKNFYNDIKDMTDYVYHSSEGRNFEMKKRNQEGQIGLLKTELLKMTNILKEKVELLNKEKIFLNDTISDISHQLKTPMTSLIILNDLMYDDILKETKIEFLNKIKSQLSRMEWLIKSILKLSKLGAIGIPVFAQFSGGVGIILGPTGGFILSFPIIALVVGYFCERFKSTVGIMFGMICSLLISYIIGTLQFCLVTNSDFVKGLTICVVPFIIVDIIKLSLATVVGKSILKRVNFGYSIKTS